MTVPRCQSCGATTGDPEPTRFLASFAFGREGSESAIYLPYEPTLCRFCRDALRGTVTARTVTEGREGA